MLSGSSCQQFGRHRRQWRSPLRAEDPERYGDSVSSDPLVRRALTGQTASSVVVSSGVTAPIVALTAVSPITGTDGLVVGSVTLGVDVTSGFVDGIEASTGLSSTVYGGQVRAATTLTDAAGSRQIGELDGRHSGEPSAPTQSNLYRQRHHQQSAISDRYYALG
ncbi:hypothetical protein IPG36_06670 [bacterium]|nr:MAG: hypothetical protein IPG36_06670 [bacterium]